MHYPVASQQVNSNMPRTDLTDLLLHTRVTMSDSADPDLNTMPGHRMAASMLEDARVTTSRANQVKANPKHLRLKSRS